MPTNAMCDCCERENIPTELTDVGRRKLGYANVCESCAETLAKAEKLRRTALLNLRLRKPGRTSYYFGAPRSPGSCVKEVHVMLHDGGGTSSSKWIVHQAKLGTEYQSDIIREFECYEGDRAVSFGRRLAKKLAVARNAPVLA